MVRNRELTKEDRQTITILKSVGLSFKEIAKKSKVSVSTISYTIKSHLEAGGNSEEGFGRLKATTESEDKFLTVNNLHNKWLTGQQLEAQLNTDRSKQVSVSTEKKTLS